MSAGMLVLVLVLVLHSGQPWFSGPACWGCYLDSATPMLPAGLGMMYYLNCFETTAARQPELVLAGGAGASNGGSSAAELPATFNNKHNVQTTQPAPGTDVGAVAAGAASVSTLQTWPEGHPLGLKDALMAAALRQDGSGMPSSS